MSLSFFQNLQLDLAYYDALLAEQEAAAAAKAAAAAAATTAINSTQSLIQSSKTNYIYSPDGWTVLSTESINKNWSELNINNNWNMYVQFDILITTYYGNWRNLFIVTENINEYGRLPAIFISPDSTNLYIACSTTENLNVDLNLNAIPFNTSTKVTVTFYNGSINLYYNSVLLTTQFISGNLILANSSSILLITGSQYPSDGGIQIKNLTFGNLSDSMKCGTNNFCLGIEPDNNLYCYGNQSGCLWNQNTCSSDDDCKSNYNITSTKYKVGGSACPTTPISNAEYNSSWTIQGCPDIYNQKELSYNSCKYQMSSSELQCYQNNNPDLKGLSPIQLQENWSKSGCLEDRNNQCPSYQQNSGLYNYIGCYNDYDYAKYIETSQSANTNRTETTILYELNNPIFDSYTVIYTTNNSGSFNKSINRISYRMEVNYGGVLYYVQVTFDAWSGATANTLGIPDYWNQFVVQQTVNNMVVESNFNGIPGLASGVTTGSGFTGYLQIWSYNYWGNSSGNYGYGNRPTMNQFYGAFQVYNISNPNSPETILAWNNHNSSSYNPDIGFGNYLGSANLDWTFSGSGSLGTNSFNLQISVITTLPVVTIVDNVNSNSGPRALPNYRGIVNSIDECESLATSNKDSLFGVQGGKAYGGQAMCFTGNDPINAKQYGLNVNRNRCPVMGGSWTNQVYQRTVPFPPPQPPQPVLTDANFAQSIETFENKNNNKNTFLILILVLIGILLFFFILNLKNTK